MNILETIIERKKSEVRKQKSEIGIAELERSEYFSRQALSLKKALLDVAGTGIIAEFKRKSPSKGTINDKADVKEITKAFVENGASGLSVLTDAFFFGGSNNDLVKARVNQVPLLRKDFIIDEYQIVEAKSIGADLILLIAACLDPEEVKKLTVFAKNFGMEVLLELHDEKELNHICDETELVGINNRNLKTFEVNIERSLKMAEKIPADKIKIAESGIDSVENIFLFKEHGFKGFLIGELFMKHADPGIAFTDFVKKLNSQTDEQYK